MTKITAAALAGIAAIMFTAAEPAPVTGGINQAVEISAPGPTRPNATN